MDTSSSTVRRESPARGRRRALRVLWLSLLVCWPGGPSGTSRAADQLSQQDHDDLIYHLNIIAADDGWPQDSVNAANAILADEQYTAVAWDTFFAEYFTDYPFCNNLEVYLGYPVFWWFSDTVHSNLQTGLSGPLMSVNAWPDWDYAIATGDSVFADDATLREDLYNSLRFFVWFGTHDDIDAATRQTIFDQLCTLVTTCPGVLAKPVTFDRAAEPYFGALRAVLYGGLLATVENFDADGKAQIASVLELDGAYAQLWDEHTCLLMDNNLANEAQLAFIHGYLSALPPNIHNLHSITINDYLGNSVDYQEVVLDIARPPGAVNIFGVPIGAYAENSFPADVDPGYVDIFCIVVAHEVNHIVNAWYVQGNASLAARRQELLDQAGNDHMQYLRSMFEDGFFQNAPQEFVASIANQWFTSSFKTLELGLVRFDAGYHEPINQVLFFAEIYSLGGMSTRFYTIDTAGNLTTSEVPLERDGNGHICALIVDETRYEFELDDAGNVLAYTTGPACPGDFGGDGDVDLADLANLLAHYGWTVGATYHDGDMDGDGDVDLQDLGLFLAHYGEQCW